LFNSVQQALPERALAVPTGKLCCPSMPYQFFASNMKPFHITKVSKHAAQTNPCPFGYFLG
jgi:hypothetical protein